MKKLFVLLLVSAQAYGQVVDYNKIILPDHIQSPDFAEKLVQLAWRNNPITDIAKRNVSIATYEVKKSPGYWLDIIHLQGNLNEFTINPATDDNGRAAFYPRYNVRANISLGMFFTIPYQVKQSRERVAIAESEVNSQKLEMRNVVMKTYNEYLMREKVFKIQTQLLSDTENSHKLVEQKFKNGEVTYEQFSASQNGFNRITISFLEAERDYKNSKLDLERLIGLKLEDVR